jgi:hypothetical protein
VVIPRGAVQVPARSTVCVLISRTDSDDVVPTTQFDVRNGDVHTEDPRRKRHGRVVGDHGEQARDLLVIVVTVNRRLFDKSIQSRTIEPGHAARIPIGGTRRVAGALLEQFLEYAGGSWRDRLVRVEISANL